MASPSGTSSGSSLMQISGSEEDLQTLMDQRKKRRKISNRESARRSRMRKQKHLDDLTDQVSQLRKENDQIIARIKLTTQHFLAVEAKNSILRAQFDELRHWLQSLNEIVGLLNANNIFLGDSSPFNEPADSFFNPLNMPFLNQPIMASPADVLR